MPIELESLGRLWETFCGMALNRDTAWPLPLLLLNIDVWVVGVGVGRLRFCSTSAAVWSSE